MPYTDFKLLQTECASPDPSGLAREASGSRQSPQAPFSIVLYISYF